MSRFIKEKMVEQYGERFRDVSAVAVISTRGVDAIRMAAFRSTLRGRGIQAMRIHNRLGGRALATGDLAGIEALFDGPSTVVWGGDSIVDIAKVLKDEAARLVELQIRGGMSDGEIFSQKQLQVLSELPGREELIGMAVGMAIGQASRVVAAAMSVASQLLGQIREIEEQASAAEAPAQEEPKADEPATAEADEPAAAQTAPDETPQQEAAEEQQPDETEATEGAQEPPAPDEAPDEA
jgi:large subunit ribosomal protein L10